MIYISMHPLDSSKESSVKAVQVEAHLPTCKDVTPASSSTRWNALYIKRVQKAHQDAKVSLKRAATRITPICLPSTSDASSLMPRRRRLTRRGIALTHKRAPVPNTAHPESQDVHTPSESLVALHQSVVENGEGLVRRMREWEARRSLDGINFNGSALDQHDEARYPVTDGEGATVDTNQPGVRLLSDCGGTGMDIVASHNHTEQPYPASPLALSPTCAPVDAELEDEIEFSLHPSPVGETDPSVMGTPALSYALSSSANSSMTSLSLPPTTARTTNSFRPALISIPSSTCNSDKAVAELTLALAAGAGSIADYGDIDRPLDMNECNDEHEHIGSMWD